MVGSISKSFALILIICLGITVAQADWRCRIHNGSEGKSWYASGPSRALAISHAMTICAHHSRVETQCVIDFCHHDRREAAKVYENTRFAGGGPWHCEVENSAGAKFLGSGTTRQLAVGRASGLCSANTIYPRRCIVKGCFVR